MNIIELAKEAADKNKVDPFTPDGEWVVLTPAELERFAALIRAEREWVDLTDDEMWAVFISRDWTGEPLHLMSAIIAAFKEKNK